LGQDPNFGSTALINNNRFNSIASANPQFTTWNVQHAMGVVITHEFGHFLLQQAHSSVGIMREGNDQGMTAFYVDLGGGQTFTPPQKTVIDKEKHPGPPASLQSHGSRDVNPT